MKKVNHLLFYSLVILIVTSCSTGSKAYKRGDYFKACIESIDHLRSSPTSEKSQTVLINAYPLALKMAEREIANAQAANQQDKFDVLVSQYERVNQLANEIYRCPKANELIANPKEYITELADAKNNAAEQNYALGLKAYDLDNIEQARVAYNYFVKANQYVNGYKDVLRKIADARYEATLRVVVQKPLTSANYQYSADFFYTNLVSEMSQNAQNRFVRFYTEDEAYKENMKNPHQYIVLNFEDFTVGNIKETMKTLDVKRDSVVVGQVQVEGKSYNAYSTVKAQLNTFRREISSRGILSLRIVDALNSRVIQQRNFSGEYVWATTWSTFKGDDRALNKEQKDMCNKQAQIAPQQQDLFIEFTKPIYTQAVSYVRSAYVRY
ncbi:MAG: hypothetical protein WCG93_11330 [Paludibacter sp.]